MDYLIGLIDSVLNDPAYAEWAFYIIAALAGITLAMALSYIISGVYSPIRKRIKKLPVERVTNEQEMLSTLEHRISKKNDKSLFKFSSDETRRLMVHAGLHSENALAVFNGIRLILLLLAAIASVILLKFFPELSGIVTIYLIFLCFGVAFLLPSLVLQHIANQRMRKLRVGFPDALDLLVVCCEAGLGLLAAMQRVAKELAISHEDLAEELELVCAKVRAGLTIRVALEEFTERTGLDDVKGLNSAISQSIRLGTGIAETLRVFSDEYRDKRLQAAEEQAAKLAVKMIFPMMCCIWPSFFIVAVGPAVLKVMQVWGSAF